MMKRAAILCAAAIAAFEAFGIGATQEWVRRHVVDALTGVVRSSKAANIEVASNIPASAFSGADTNDIISCTIRAGVGSHPALKVVESSVPEIPAGTFYALDDNGNYVNCSNALINTIYAAPYTVSHVSTNAFGGVSTNSVRMGNFWATDSTNGVWRMGIDGDTFLYNSGKRSAYFAIRSTTLPERAAAALIPPRSARLSVRDMLSLIMPTACAATREEIVYTVNSERTIAITTITFTRTNRFGKTTTITFTPEGLEGVYSGPSGPFETKAEAEEAVTNLDNWDFKYNGDSSWLRLIDPNERIEISRSDFERSDVWKQLVSAVGTERVEVEIPTPKMPAHPCPAPDDIWTLDQQANEWVPNTSYITVSGNEWDWNTDKLDEWRGRNDCKCAVVGCPNCGVSKHRPGRVKVSGGEETYSDDADGSDGCKCCIRCTKYGSDFMKTINEYNDHRASGEGAGFCGCACGKYDAENESEWPQDFHNLPAHTLAWPSLDFSCMCYCAKDKALNGEYVRHAKYAGDSPWCDNICARCGMVEDQEQYISHSYPAFDTRHVTLREAEWKDHKPRSEAEAGVSLLNDPTYYDRCGCACGAYDTKNGGLLPAEFGDFHQYHNVRTCLCTCGQVHRKNSMGDGEDPAEPWPCPEICAVCNKVEDKGTDQTITIDGTAYRKLVLVDPDDEKYHEADGAECGCKCYNGTYGGQPSKHAWSVGLEGIEGIAYEGTIPKFHKRADTGCACRCGMLCDTATDSSLALWQMAHGEWFEESDCPGICSVCQRKKMLGAVAQMSDHTPSDVQCGCKCGEVTHETQGANTAATKAFHVARDADYSCLCECGTFHDGEWSDKTCGANTWQICSINAEHTKGTVAHQYANGYPNDAEHYCKCSDKLTASHTTSRTQTGVEPGFKIYTVSCTVSGCGWSRTEKEACTHVWGNWIRISDFPGGTLFRKTCSVCGAPDDMLVSYADAQNCNTNINLHIPADDTCGCKCGYYGTRVAEEKDFHKWDATDTAGGIANCHCMCGTKHEWREGCDCPNVCAFCKKVRKDGTAADESDHIAATENRCGCKCGYYGVTSQHASVGRSAASPHLHKRATGNGHGTDSAPANCQCYGELNSSGGKRHWHDPNSSATCPRVCKWRWSSMDKIGHLAASASVDPDVGDPRRAEPSDHVRKAYGCGCLCGLCNAVNGVSPLAAYVDVDKALHNPPQSSASGNLCACECGKYDAAAKDQGDIEGHRFPSQSSTGKPMCICTCGKRHRALSGRMNACGYCSECKRIWKSDTDWKDASMVANHSFVNGRCYCDGGCLHEGNYFLHPEGHVFQDNSCSCMDLHPDSSPAVTLDHIVQSTSTVLDQTTCSRCGAIFQYVRLSLSCARCGLGIGQDKYTYVGKHATNCGTPNNPKPGCAVCGCYCSYRCSGHYCSACCKAKPTPRPKRPTPNDPTIPDPCNHDGTGRKVETSTSSYTCDICHHTLTSTTRYYYCLNCYALVNTEHNSTGSHGTHPDDPSGEDPSEPPEGCEYCGATDGHHAADCPYYEPTGGGGTGGNGNIDDI